MKQGLEEGLKDGLKEGQEEGIRKVAQALKAAGLPVQVIAQTTGLTPDEIAAL